MKICKVHGGPYRTGSIVFLLTPKGLKGVRACTKCAEGGVTLVTAVPQVPTTKERKSEEELDLRRVLRGLARKYRGLMKLCGESSLRRDAFAQAATIAEVWAKEPGARVTS